MNMRARLIILELGGKTILLSILLYFVAAVVQVVDVLLLVVMYNNGMVVMAKVMTSYNSCYTILYRTGHTHSLLFVMYS